jgi:hypothetical protein
MPDKCYLCADPPRYRVEWWEHMTRQDSSLDLCERDKDYWLRIWGKVKWYVEVKEIENA